MRANKTVCLRCPNYQKEAEICFAAYTQWLIKKYAPHHDDFFISENVFSEWETFCESMFLRLGCRCHD